MKGAATFEENAAMKKDFSVAESISCSQEIEICFKFVGRYLPLDFVKKATGEELEAIEIERKEKEKEYAASLRRKENGWQKAYDTIS